MGCTQVVVLVSDGTPADHATVTAEYQAAKVLDLGTWVGDIDSEVASLRDSRKVGKLSPAIVGASKAIIHARLALIDKILPTLKSENVTGEVSHDHKHQIQQIDSTELAMRLNLWRQEKLQADPKVINAAPVEQASRIVNAAVKRIEEDLVDVPRLEPADYDWL